MAAQSSPATPTAEVLSRPQESTSNVTLARLYRCPAPDAGETSKSQQEKVQVTDVFKYVELADGHVWMRPHGSSGSAPVRGEAYGRNHPLCRQQPPPDAVAPRLGHRRYSCGPQSCPRPIRYGVRRGAAIAPIAKLNPSGPGRRFWSAASEMRRAPSRGIRSASGS
jgi:hypothetical protein